jgi:hypothetical protein
MDLSFLLLGCIVFALGVFALVEHGKEARYKSSMQTELGLLDPAKDFSVAEPCIIVNVTWLYANQTRKKVSNSLYGTVACTDHFIYNFALLDEFLNDQNHSEIYQSDVFAVNRTEESCDGFSEIAKTPYSLGAEVDCWIPTSEDLEKSFYNCGNEDCIKVLDPQGALDSYYEIATSLVAWVLPVGIVAVLVGLLCCCYAPFAADARCC